MISSSSISKSLLLSTLVCNISLLSSRLADHTIRLLSRLTNRTIVAFVDGVLQANISIYGWRDLNSSSRLRRQQRLRMPRPARWGRLGRCPRRCCLAGVRVRVVQVVLRAHVGGDVDDMVDYGASGAHCGLRGDVDVNGAQKGRRAPCDRPMAGPCGVFSPAAVEPYHNYTP